MITSTSNARVKELVQLQKKSKVRNEQGVFLVEGVKMYQRQKMHIFLFWTTFRIQGTLERFCEPQRERG